VRAEHRDDGGADEVDGRGLMRGRDHGHHAEKGVHQRVFGFAYGRHGSRRRLRRALRSQEPQGASDAPGALQRADNNHLIDRDAQARTSLSGIHGARAQDATAPSRPRRKA
jgi:hypothetical protein